MEEIGVEIQRLVEYEYGIGKPNHCRLIHGGWGVNDTWEVGCINGRSHVLRLQSHPHSQKKDWMTGESDLRFELDLLTHLHDRDVPVSYPLPRRNGSLFGSFDTREGERLYALFSWAPGRTIDVEHLMPDQAWLVGHTLATVHRVADKFETTHIRYRLDETTLLDKPLGNLEPFLQNASLEDAWFIREQVVQIRERLRAYVPGPEGWGIIHSDIQGLNYHFTDDGQMTLFDFDLCGYGWRAYDVAYYYTRIPAGLRDSVLHGYQAVRPLSPAEHEMLTTFGQVAWVWEGLSPQELALRLRNPYV